MRVLMIGPDRGLFGGGSSGDVVARHQKYADGAGELDIIVFASSSYADKAISDNLHVFSTRSSKPTHWWGAVRRAQELFQTHPYDLVVCQELASPAGATLKRKLGSPLLIGVHSMFYEREWLGFNLGRWYLYYKIKKALPSADGFRVNTDVIKKKLRSWGLEQPILVQPTPGDVGMFMVDAKEGRHGAPTVLYVGRLSSEKNVGLLIRAFKKLEMDAELQIVGEGPEKEKLEALARGGKHITFLGKKSHEELRDIYKHANIFVLPSNTESFGKVLLEAAAAQCAIIATRTAGAQALLKEHEAVFVPVGDEDALEKALHTLCLDVSLRGHLGKVAQETARLHNADEGTQKTVDFWKEVARK